MGKCTKQVLMFTKNSKNKNPKSKSDQSSSPEPFKVVKLGKFSQNLNRMPTNRPEYR